MTGIADRDFGELNFDGVWTGLFEILIFGSLRKVELVIQVFDEDSIAEVQRLAFREFDLNKNSVSMALEKAVFSYYFRRVEEYREGFDADEANIKAPKAQAVDDMRDLVSLRCIKVMSPFDSGSRQIGFIFDATFDPQLGLGVLVTNGSVETVDTQDFLLG
ncbi:DUF6985 domain-containing protein [Pseudomonas petrae]|uniref:DUF6985 domain-containing protein n=1 Tax=Pseudomonas petrae TaxID=2912190 RepID=UPI001EF12142|nr:hypothetical protein [Pseudomonas petrae]MCF7531654.1 hypothetical protein [Pseudomonas petrae]MCF7537217.1 hypothetical protein [Pseudomonas petrae]MCF7556323.1 hypothetical protein [Pseudomonas petrae]